jgi:hypothetical protein
MNTNKRENHEIILIALFIIVPFCFIFATICRAHTLLDKPFQGNQWGVVRLGRAALRTVIYFVSEAPNET